MLFDTHAHYNDIQFKDDADELLSSMPENNVGLIMVPASKLSETEDILALCRKYPFMYAAVGIHPEEIDSADENSIELIKKYAADSRVKAIGEIGLDYHYGKDTKDKQKLWLGLQTDAARELKLPVIIHDREAHGDCMDVLREHKVRDCGGVFHCYSGSIETAHEILDWGMYIAFGGSLTFKNARQPREVAEYVPLDRIVIETDSPYLAPVPMRGKRNSSLYIHYVAELLAQIKGVSVEEIERITFENGKKLFNIK